MPPGAWCRAAVRLGRALARWRGGTAGRSSADVGGCADIGDRETWASRCVARRASGPRRIRFCARPEKSCHRLRDDEAERRRDRRPIASRVHHDTAGPRRPVGGVVRGHRLSPDGRVARIRGEANDSTGCGGFDLALRAGSRSEVAVEDPTAIGAGQHRVQHSQCRRGAAFRQGPVASPAASPVVDPGPYQQETRAPGHHVTAKRGAERTRRQGPKAARRARGRSVGGAPGRRGARRDDRIRDGRRRERRERRRGLVVALAMRDIIPAGLRIELTTLRRVEPAPDLSGPASPWGARARKDTGTDSHGVSDPRDGAGTAAAAREGVAHAMLPLTPVLCTCR